MLEYYVNTLIFPHRMPICILIQLKQPLEDAPMKTTTDYLDEVKARYGLRSDYALAIKLGIGSSGINNYRKRYSHFNDLMAVKVAELLGIDPAEILAAVNAERTKCPAAKVVWERVARSFSAGVMAVFIAVALNFAPAPTHASSTNNAQQCILC